MPIPEIFISLHAENQREEYCFVICYLLAPWRIVKSDYIFAVTEVDVIWLCADKAKAWNAADVVTGGNTDAGADIGDSLIWNDSLTCTAVEILYGIRGSTVNDSCRSVIIEIGCACLQDGEVG
jgi:hypothetical protein